MKQKAVEKYGHIVIPHSCPCCRKCWLIVKGKSAGMCVYGGPYSGYEVQEPPAEPRASHGKRPQSRATDAL